MCWSVKNGVVKEGGGCSCGRFGNGRNGFDFVKSNKEKKKGGGGKVMGNV